MDDQNRQTGVVLPARGITTCTYRFDGLRSSKEDTEGTTKYLWDFENYLAETDHQNEIQAVYTNEPQQYGNLISQYRKDGAIWTPSYYQYDALGSTRPLTDDGGNATDTYLYDAWGNEVASSGSSVNPFRWVGQVGYYWDDVLGTFYIRARVYEPVLGRWMSQDPLDYPGTSPNEFTERFYDEQGLYDRWLAHGSRESAKSSDRATPRNPRGSSNAYSNVDSAPILLVDPSGMKKVGHICSYWPVRNSPPRWTVTAVYGCKQVKVHGGTFSGVIPKEVCTFPLSDVPFKSRCRCYWAPRQQCHRFCFHCTEDDGIESVVGVTERIVLPPVSYGRVELDGSCSCLGPRRQPKRVCPTKARIENLERVCPFCKQNGQRMSSSARIELK